MNRNKSAMLHRWGNITTMINRQEVALLCKHKCESTNLLFCMSHIYLFLFVFSLVVLLVYLLKLKQALRMFRDENKEKEFSFMHCFTKIQTCEKWKQVRLSLSQCKTGGRGL
jgi:hypothetical protein